MEKMDKLNTKWHRIESMYTTIITVYDQNDEVKEEYINLLLSEDDDEKYYFIFDGKYLTQEESINKIITEHPCVKTTYMPPQKLTKDIVKHHLKDISRLVI